ncbi:MAG: methylenetetrahydrofolate reductase [Fervidobacterium sp.]
MKVVDKLRNKRIISIEIIPPKRGEDVENVFSTLDRLVKYDISFINITRHPVEIEYLETKNGIIKVQKVKRPGTIGLTAALMKRYNIDVVPHLVCKGMNKFEMEEILIDLSIMGIENVFVVHGEATNETKIKGDYKYAVELVRQISSMNRGSYLYTKAKPTNFCIGVAGYPEKHFGSPNIEVDLKVLKEKVDNGAQFVITQMIFEAEIYKNFVNKCRESGIDVPIIPGVKPVVSKRSIYSIPKKFFVSIPQELVSLMEDAKSEDEEFRNGVKFTIKLIEELFDAGAPGVHIFTMGRGEEVCTILREATI